MESATGYDSAASRWLSAPEPDDPRRRQHVVGNAQRASRPSRRRRADRRRMSHRDRDGLGSRTARLAHNGPRTTRRGRRGAGLGKPPGHAREDALSAATPPTLGHVGRPLPPLQQIDFGAVTMGWLDLNAVCKSRASVRRPTDDLRARRRWGLEGAGTTEWDSGASRGKPRAGAATPSRADANSAVGLFADGRHDATAWIAMHDNSWFRRVRQKLPELPPGAGTRKGVDPVRAATTRLDRPA